MILALALAFFVDDSACAAEAALFRRGELLEARRSLDRETLKGAFCLKLSGLVYASMGHYRSSIGPFESACRLDSKEPDACYYWGRALYASDRFEDSLAALDRAHPNSTPDWKLGTARGQALDALGKVEAETVLRKALQQRMALEGSVSEPDPLLALGSFLNRQGKRDEVLKLLLGASHRYRNVAAYQYQLGRALGQAQRWSEAVEALEKAVKLEPKHLEAHGLLSRAYYRLGRTDLGAKHAAKAMGNF